MSLILISCFQIINNFLVNLSKGGLQVLTQAYISLFLVNSSKGGLQVLTLSIQRPVAHGCLLAMQ